MNQTQTQPRKGFVDFKQIKAQVSLTQVLERYHLMETLQQKGDRLSGACPIHQGSNVTQFRVSISKNCFNCFGRCGRGGNVIDFVALMEDVPFRDAAILLQSWFPQQVSVSENRASSKKRKRTRRSDARHSENGSLEDTEAQEENAPLTFELKTLQTDHPYLVERGISEEAIDHFGLGFCNRGCLRGHIAIPIHNGNGEVVAYAGRWPGVPPEGGGKYKLPKGFKKSLEVFNLHRALQEPDDFPLVIVEGFFDCIALWEAGIAKCVALIGCSLSSTQERLLLDSFSEETEIEILFDSDEAGIRGADQVAKDLAHRRNVRVISLPEPGMQPDDLEEAELASLFE